MNPLEEMTDAELAARWMSPELSLFDDSTGAVMPELLAIGAQMAMRLLVHPAQRIADLTDRVVTRDGDFDGFWSIWVEGKEPTLNKFKRWTTGDINDFICIEVALIDDNRPWQESIYKPQVNVKNGGKDESTSANDRSNT
jgi:hypothetical protein